MQYFIELLSLCLLIFCVFNLVNKKITKPILIIISYYVFEDYVSFFAGYRIGEISVWKLFLDILFVLLFIYLFFIYLTKVNSQRKTTKREAAYYSFVLISIALIPVGFFNNGFVLSVTGWRAIFLPIFLAEGLLLISRNRNDIKGDMHRLISCIIIFAAINSAASIWQYIYYDGDYTSVWRFDLLLEAKLASNHNFLEHFMQYQIERGGKLRASGFMVSALAASYFCAFGALLTLYKLYAERQKNHVKLFFILIFLLLVGGVYVSQVRTSLIILILFPFINYAVNTVKFKTSAILTFITVMLIFVAVLGLVFQGGLEASALGRIDQYRILFTEVSFLGKGLGSYLSTFDSYYIHVFMVLGVFGILPNLYFLTKVIKVTRVIREDGQNGHLKVSLVLSIIMFLVFFVQHTASSLYYFISLLVLFGAASYNSKSICFRASHLSVR